MKTYTPGTWDTSDFVRAVYDGRKLHLYQEQMLRRMLQLLDSQTFKEVFPKISARRTVCATPYRHSIIVDDVDQFGLGQSGSDGHELTISRAISTRLQFATGGQQR